MNSTKERPFPLDWNEWERQFNTWRRAFGLPPARKTIRGTNFMADEVMGTYLIKPHHVVELSAVTFPNLSERDAATGRLIERTDRMVGITWLDPSAGPADTPGINGGLVSTFAELEEALSAGPPSTSTERKAARS